MTIWEAHRTLALAIGDAVPFLDVNGDEATKLSPPTSIPDGARILRYMRDNCLYRAILKVYHEILMSIAALDKETASRILEQIMPNRIFTINFVGSFSNGTMIRTLDELGNKLMYIVNIYTNNANGKKYPIPLRYGIDINGMINSRNVQGFDAFCTHYAIYKDDTEVSCLMFFDDKDEIDGNEIYVRLLEYPRNPADAISLTDPDYNWNMDLDIEETFVPKVLNYAKLYVMQESQDIDAFAALQMEFIGQRGQGGQDANS